MGMVSNAVDRGLNAYYTVSDRNRRAEMDEQERTRYAQEMERRNRLDEENRLAREQTSNFQSQNQMMNAQNFENQQQVFGQQQDEIQRGLGMRRNMEMAGDRAMSEPMDYDGQDFAPIAGAQGLRKRTGMVHEPTYNQAMAEFDPANAPKYADDNKSLENEGILKAALLLKQGRPREAAQMYNSMGTERLGPRGFFQDPQTRKWMAEEQDGIAEFDPDKTIEYARALSGQGAEKPMILNRGDKAFNSRGGMIAENPWVEGRGMGGSGGSGGGDGSDAEKFYNIAIQTERGPVQKTFSNNEAIAFYKQIYGFPDESMMMADPAEYDRQMKAAATSAPGFQKWLSQSIVGGIGGAPEEPEPQNQQETLPPAQAHSGRVIRDTATGDRYRSNGNAWVRVPSGEESANRFPQFNGGMTAPR